MDFGRPGRHTALLTLAILAWAQGPAPTATQSPGPTYPGRPQAPVPLLWEEDDGRVPPDGGTFARPEAYATGDYRIDALLTGSSWTYPTITYSFYSTSVFGGRYYGAETGVREVSDGTKRNVRAIMEWCSAVLGVALAEVVETPTSVGHVRIMLSDNPYYAYTYYPAATTAFHVAGDVHLSPAYDGVSNTNGFQQPPGSHGYLTLIHEIGHALGLKHPHSGAPTLPEMEDSHSFTVMSYQFLGRSPATLMTYDLLALQSLYGARQSRTHDDTYVFTRATLDEFSLAGQVPLVALTPTKQTIWDTGGNNGIDLSALPWNSYGYRLDLNPLGWFSAWPDYRPNYFVSGTALGPGVIVHTVINSISNDTILANAARNVFAGYAPNRSTGHDVIVGADRTDTIDLSAFAPGDVVESPAGADLVLGLNSASTITVKQYYTGDPPAITYGPVTPPAPLPLPSGAELWVQTLQAATEHSASGPQPVVEIIVAGDGGQPVAGVRVTAKWGGMIRASQAGTTDANGRIVFRMKPLKGPCMVTFNVASAVKDGYSYNPDRGTELPLTIAVR